MERYREEDHVEDGWIKCFKIRDGAYAQSRELSMRQRNIGKLSFRNSKASMACKGMIKQQFDYKFIIEHFSFEYKQEFNMLGAT